MYFKRLDMHGFKSFAEPVSLEFTDGMTCIVGPNGSGKSNIADAIKWVLGEQSPKNLRGGKMEEVIFAGTENRKARGIAEVTLVIDNKDGILPIEFNEVAITRKMYRSGESEYLINGRNCRLKDVKELILDTGMGVEGYSLIGQGKIAEIVSNKAEGRRELFEAAAGISKYRVRKADAEKKLENSKNNLDRVNDIISEIEGRIGNLKEDSVKAEEYIKLSSKYKNIEINLAVIQAESIEARTAVLKSEIANSENLLKDFSLKKEENDKETEALSKKHEELQLKLEDIRRVFLERNQEINQAKSGLKLSQERLSACKRDIDRVSTELGNSVERLEKETSEINEYEAKMRNLESELDEKRRMLRKNENEYNIASSEAESKYEEIEKNKSDVFQIHSKINVSKTEISGYRTLLEGLEKRKAKLSEDLRDSEEIISEFESKLSTSETDVQKTAADRKATLEDLKYVQAEKDDMELKHKDLISVRDETENHLHKAVTKRDLLKGFEASYEGYGYAVKFIMSRRNRIKGIHGVTSELIDVPEGYETALQTALGGGMQNIVCEDDKAAADCVNMLKRERAGRATFLPVKSIRGGKNISSAPDADRLRQESGFLGFATEIVKCQPQYNRIVEYLLGRIAVADTLDTAVKLSKIYRNGIRFVTLDGDDVNPSGAITGGRLKNSGPNVFERKNDIKALEASIEGYSSDLEKLKAEITGIEDKLRIYLMNIDEKEKRLKEYESNLTGFRTNMDVLTNRKQAVQENLIRWKREAGDIDKEIEETERLISSIQIEVDKNLEGIKKYENLVEDDTNAYEESKKKADSILSEINRLKIELSSGEGDKRHTEEAVAKGKKEHNRLKDEIQQKKDELSRLDSLKNETDLSIEAFKAEISRLENDYEACKSQTGELEKERETGEAKLKELEKYGKELGASIDKELSAKHDAEIKAAKNEMQADSIKNRLWDSFETTFVEALSMKQEGFSLNSAQRESRELKLRMRELEPVNIGAIEEYKQVSERYEFLNDQKKDLNEAIDSLNAIIKDMDKKINIRFMSSFEEIAVEFKKAFVELFGGGTARLQLDNAENVLECSVEIIAQPPGKKLQNINLLSGGEKSLTAIALLCAILKVRPTPFCILDEVEAALDDLNIGRFVEYIRAFEEVQFIVVTHQKVTMEKSDAMYGITMPEKGVSRVVSLKMKK